MIKHKDYRTYNLSHGSLPAANGRKCYHCKKLINLPGQEYYTINKKVHPSDYIFLSLFFHAKCFMSVAGESYVIEGPEEVKDL
jgi:hypothetical protein